MTAAVVTQKNGQAVLELTHEEVLAEFAAVMREWGFANAEGLRFPTEAEIQGTRASRQRRRKYGGPRP